MPAHSAGEWRVSWLPYQVASAARAKGCTGSGRIRTLTPRYWLSDPGDGGGTLTCSVVHLQLLFFPLILQVQVEQPQMERTEKEISMTMEINTPISLEQLGKLFLVFSSWLLSRRWYKGAMGSLKTVSIQVLHQASPCWTSAQVTVGVFIFYLLNSVVERLCLWNNSFFVLNFQRLIKK